MQVINGSTTEYTTKELSLLSGIPQTTLREWERFFSIPVNRNDLGQRKYTENMLNLFREIKKYKTEGLRLEEIKPLLNMNTQGNGSYTEVIRDSHDMPEQEQNYSLIVKPYTDRITLLEKAQNSLAERNLILERDNATLTERVSGINKESEKIYALKDSIITDKETSINELKARLQEAETRLNRKWWKVWS